ncbi:MAG TPA: hypothetical protein VEH27_08775, partial [Methylomirabilota bacterium]|nr:hypothetical protein [Methylomirabilota bacterium]
ICSSEDGLQVVDMRDVTNPVTVVSRFSVGGRAARCQVVDSLLYVAAETGLQVVDVSTPTKPVRVQRLPLSGRDVWDVEVAGDFAYLTTAGTNVHIVDIRDRRAPVLVKTVTVAEAGRSDDVEVVDGTMYVTLDQGGLRIFDLAIPDSPALIGRINGTSQFQPVSIIVRDGFAYMSTRMAGLQVYDVHDPANITYAGELRTVRGSSYLEVGLTMASGRLFYNVLSPGPLLAVTPLPAYRRTLGTLPITSARSENSGLAAGRTGLLLFNGQTREVATADPTTLHAVHTNTNPYWFNSPLVNGRGAVHRFGSSFDTYERMPDDTFVLRGSAQVPIGSWSSRMVLKDDHVLAPAGTAGLQMINIADLTKPQFIGALTNWHTVSSIVHENERAAITAKVTSTSGSGVFLLDITAAHHPTVMSQIQELGSAELLSITDARLYATTYTNVAGVLVTTLLIYDVQNTQKPSYLGNIRLSQLPTAMVVHRGTAALGSSSGLEFIDVRNPEKPGRLGGNSAVNGFHLLLLQDTLYALGPRQLSALRLADASSISLKVPSLTAGGGITINLLNIPVGFQLLRSFDLTNWSVWKTVVPNEPVDFTDAADGSRAFYRGWVP